jgi:ankyrin repeat protein
MAAAVASGDLDTVKVLINSKASINHGSPLRSPLADASGAGHTHIVRYLLHLGAAVTSQGLLQSPPLLQAAAHGHAAAVTLLADAGADVDSADARKALFSAAAGGGCLALVLELLGGEPAPAAREVEHALRFAAEKGHVAVVQALVAASGGASISARDQAVVSALKGGHVDVVKTLIDTAGPEAMNKPCFTEGSLLVHAAEGGSAAAVALLLRHGADVRARSHGKTALSQASDPAVVRLLLDSGAAVHGDGGGEALVQACKRLQPESVRLLLDARATLTVGADAGSGVKVSPLLCAVNAQCASDCEDDHVAVINHLIDAGALDHVNSDPYARAELCASMCRVSSARVVETLLRRDPGLLLAVDYTGNNLLLAAVRQGNVEMMRCLIKLGMDVNQRDSRGRTPLLYGIALNLGFSLHTVMALLHAGADATSCSNDGETTLMAAMTSPMPGQCRAAVVEALIEALQARS